MNKDKTIEYPLFVGKITIEGTVLNLGYVEIEYKGEKINITAKVDENKKISLVRAHETKHKDIVITITEDVQKYLNAVKAMVNILPLPEVRQGVFQIDETGRAIPRRGFA